MREYPLGTKAGVYVGADMSAEGKTLMEVFEKEDKPDVFTIEEIYERLGLQDPKEFAAKRIAHNLEKRWGELPASQHLSGATRSTGCTTYMMVHALREAHQGKMVEVVGRTRTETGYMATQMGRFAKHLGISDELVRRRVGDHQERLVFDDIFWGSR